MSNQNYENMKIPADLSSAVMKGLKNGKHQRKKEYRKKFYISSLAGLTVGMLCFFSYCYANPAFAAELPIIGRIFSQTEALGEFPGDYSSKSQPLSEENPVKMNSENISSMSEEDKIQDLVTLYGDTQQELTIVPEEVYCDGASLFIGLRLLLPEEQSFGMDISKLSKDQYQLDYCSIQVIGTWSDGSAEHSFSEWLIGNQKNPNTFIGKLKLPAANINTKADEIKINIKYLFWSKVELSSQENASVSDSHVLKDGNWNIHFPLVIDDTQLKTFDINDTNELGFGIEKIILTPYELQIESLVPTLSKELLDKVYSDFSEKCKNNLDANQENALFEDILLDSNDLYWYGGFAVFNQDGEYLDFVYIDENTHYYEVEMKNIEKLYIYLLPDGIAAYKCKNQEFFKNCNIYSYTLEIK